jgi:prepilin-type N-terminal cleavage/methylation domain-containing protein
MKNRKKGFTLVELMLVIAVMAILATLSIGGFMKILRNAREKRINAMRDSLELALVNFRGHQGRWPVGLKPARQGDYIVTFRGSDQQGAAKNWEVFEEIVKDGKYLSAADYLTRINGQGMVVSLQEAIDGKDKRGRSLPGGTKPLGYANPLNQRTFHYFYVEFNLLTDSAKVWYKWKCSRCDAVLPCSTHGEID